MDEIDLQIKFYERIGVKPDLSHNTDGVYRGYIFENKKSIDDINEVLWQAIKYLARTRERGEKMPANIILNDFSREQVHIYKTQDVFEEIHGDYFGAASKNNRAMPTIYNKLQYITIKYNDSDGLMKLLEIVNKEEYIRYRVDNRNIYGLAREFYRLTYLNMSW
ncbi:MAG: hypothetical protein LBQ40_00410 [Clostridiales bacterium]|jgi:hypothetical protein|nr:hypothetical protein [Clostridiales bacterium]